MAEERPKEPEIKVSEDGINANFSLSPRLDQPPSRPMGATLRRTHHHNRNHSIDTKDRTSPILGFGPLQSSERSWSVADLGGGADHHNSSSEQNSSSASNSLDPSRAMNGAYEYGRPKPAPAVNLSASPSASMYASARKVSAGSNSTSSSSSTGSASPDASFSSTELRRSNSRSSERHQPNGASHNLADGSSTRRTASPARAFSGAPISPRLQSTMSAQAGLAHARRASADLIAAPFRAPSPIFLPSTSPPTGPTNADAKESWDSVWPRSSTPDRADQLRRLGSASPIAGSPGQASPSALSDAMNMSRSPSTSFDSSSPAATTVLGRPKARRPHELRGYSSSPVLRINASGSGLRDTHDPTRSPRRSLEAARTEPIIKIGFTPPSGPGTPGSAGRARHDPPVLDHLFLLRAPQVESCRQLQKLHRTSMLPMPLHRIATAAVALHGCRNAPSRLRLALLLPIQENVPPRCLCLTLCHFRQGRPHPRCRPRLLARHSSNYLHRQLDLMARTDSARAHQDTQLHRHASTLWL